MPGKLQKNSYLVSNFKFFVSFENPFSQRDFFGEIVFAVEDKAQKKI